MQEVDLFLHSLLDKVGVLQVNNDWKGDRAAYWLPNEEATVGFYWWEKWRDPSHENTLCVIQYKPEKRRMPTASLQEIVTASAVAKQQNRLDDYVTNIADQVRGALNQS